MKSVTHLVLILTVLALLAALTAPVRAAQVLFEYDFESLVVGDLAPSGSPATAGQDGWIVHGSKYTVSASQTNTSGWDLLTSTDPENPGKVARTKELNITTARRGFASPIAFTSADTAIEVSVWMKLGATTNGFVWAGVEWEGQAAPWTMTFGLLTGASSTGPISLRAYDYTGSTLGPTDLVRGHWYEIKEVMDFSVAGGQMTTYYRDVTNGDIAFTQAAGLTNIALNITPNINGEYVATGLNLRANIGSTTNPQTRHLLFIDNFRVTDLNATEIPEPSSLALVMLGAMGFGAFAARRRRQTA